MKGEYRIIGLSLVFGIAAWIIDTFLDMFFFHPGTFMEIFITEVPPHALYVRLVEMASFLTFGLLISVQYRHRKKAEELLLRTNRILLVIRDVNQLIVREKDPDKLLQNVCDTLTENQGYHHAWFALLDDSGKFKSLFQAGLNGDYAPIVERWEHGEAPECVQKVLSDTPVAFIQNPPTECKVCPNTFKYADRYSAIIRIDHNDTHFGYLYVSIAKEMVQETEETELLKKLAGDIGSALHAIHQEAKSQRAIRALWESKINYETIFNAVNDMIVVSDSETGKPLDANQKVTEKLGYFLNELLELNIGDWSYGKPPYTQTEAIQWIKEAAKGSPQMFEWLCKKKNGELMWVEVNLKSITLNNRPVVLAVARDITERKEYEEDLVKSEGNFRAILNAITESIFLVDSRYDIIASNKAGAKRLEHTPKEFVGKNILDLFPPDVAEYRRKKFDEVIRTGKPLRFTDSRGPYHFHTSMFPVIDDQGQVTEIAVFAMDITAQIESEKKMKDLRGQLRQAQKMEAIGTMSGGVAHDFNNILAIILGFTELTMQKISDSSPIARNIKEIHTASLRAKELVRQLLMFSRKAPIERRPFDIAAMVKETIGLLRASIPTSIEFVQSIKEDAGFIMGDPTQVSQILLNICTNARDAIENDGILTIDLEKTDLDEKQADPLGLAPGSYVKLSIKDTGCGISPENMDRIFDPYFTTKGLGKGTGMGLALVHGIVISHEGAITVDSRLTEGTTVTVFFPSLKETAAADIKIDDSVPGGSERILLIDDEELIIDINHEILEGLGYNVGTAIDPEKALEIVTADPYSIDLVITDMTMPKMTGDCLTKLLLKIRPDLPVILCTGYSEKMSEEKAKEIGVKAFVMKPFQVTDLARIIRKVLDHGD